jgi:hypothetical protein
LKNDWMNAVRPAERMKGLTCNACAIRSFSMVALGSGLAGKGVGVPVGDDASLAVTVGDRAVLLYWDSSRNEETRLFSLELGVSASVLVAGVMSAFAARDLCSGNQEIRKLKG